MQSTDPTAALLPSVSRITPSIMAEQQSQAHSSNVLQEAPANDTIRLSYEVPLPVRLRSTFNSVARFLGNMQQAYQDPADAEEFLPIKHGYRFVDSYRDRLILLYSRPETQHLSRERWKASEIRTYKDKKTRVTYEYLVATLNDQFGNIVLFRFERRVQDSVIKSLDKSLIPVGVSTTSPPAGSTSANLEEVQEKKSKKFMKRALQQISIIKPSNFNVKQVPVEHIVFDPDVRVSLPELVILACTIRDYSREIGRAHV